MNLRYRIDTEKLDGARWMGVGHVHGADRAACIQEMEAIRNRRLSLRCYAEVTIREATDADEAAWNAYLAGSRKVAS